MKKNIVKLQRFGSDFFIDNNFFGNDGFQNMFVYQPTFYLLGYKQVGSGYVILWLEIQRMYINKFVPLHNLEPNVKYFNCRTGLL